MNNASKANPQERYDWIKNYIANCDEACVSIVDANFVDAYINRFSPAFSLRNYGAAKCDQLGRDLSMMFSKGLLARCSIGIAALPVSGFPKWVYCYSLE